MMMMMMINKGKGFEILVPTNREKMERLRIKRPIDLSSHGKEKIINRMKEEEEEEERKKNQNQK